MSIASNLPLPIFLWLAYDMSKNVSAIYSTVAGPKEPLVYAGYKVMSMQFSVTSVGEVANCLSVITMIDKISVGMLTDTAVTDNPKELMDML